MPESINKTCEELYQELVDKVNIYHPNARMQLIESAYNLASEAHKGQFRKSGEPFVIHPLWVATILAELRLDTETIVAAILHDVVEDTPYTLEYIEEHFGEEVAVLVDGVTKLRKFQYTSKTDELAENYRKMFFAMSQDIRIIIMKIADRLHNMRTLSAMTEEKQKEIAQETLEIYAPLAHKLGMSRIRYELEDLGFKYMDNKTYLDLAQRIGHKREERRKLIDVVVQELQEKFDKDSLHVKVEGRPKHLFSIYRKMMSKKKSLDEIYDLYAVRILTDESSECYQALGTVHATYTPVPGRFKDYIANPKQNRYQSLHTTILREGIPFEVQIRTHEMHRVAELGVAAHWRYKTGQQSDGDTNTAEDKLQWLGRLLEWQRDLEDNEEYIDAIKFDLGIFNKSIYCFSPGGDVYSLRSGSTVIDFAYAVHSGVGNRMVGAKVNDAVVPINHELSTGDRVEIMTSQNQTPNIDWLKIVKTTQARTKINQWFRKQNRPENIQKGRDLLEAFAKNVGVTLENLLADGRLDIVLKRYNAISFESLCATVGHGGLKEGQVVNRLYDAYKKAQPVKLEDLVEELLKAGNKAFPNQKKSKSGVLVKGVGDTNVRFSICCGPLPGDNIVGFVTRGRGVSLHRSDCINVSNLDDKDKQRIIQAQWDVTDEDRKAYRADLIIRCRDEQGLLMDITRLLFDEGINTKALTVRTEHSEAVMDLGVDITNREQFQRLQDKIRNHPGVNSVARANI